LTKALYLAWREMGFIKEPGPPAGTSIEELREKYRHEERMKELEIEKEHKQELARIASEIPKKIGRGIATALREEEETVSTLEYFICDDCKTKIYIPPGAGKEVFCGHCGAKYQRQE